MTFCMEVANNAEQSFAMALDVFERQGLWTWTFTNAHSDFVYPQGEFELHVVTLGDAFTVHVHGRQKLGEFRATVAKRCGWTPTHTRIQIGEKLLFRDGWTLQQCGVGETLPCEIVAHARPVDSVLATVQASALETFGDTLEDRACPLTFVALRALATLSRAWTRTLLVPALFTENVSYDDMGLVFFHVEFGAITDEEARLEIKAKAGVSEDAFADFDGEFRHEALSRAYILEREWRSVYGSEAIDGPQLITSETHGTLLRAKRFKHG